MLVALIYRVYYATLKIQVVNAPDLSKPLLVAHWHGEEWALMGFFKNRGWALMVSHSKDGQLLDRFLKSLGFRTARGSSSKGAASGFLSLIRVIKKEKTSGSLAVDGPRGPYHEVKAGIVKLASVTELPLYGVRATEISRKWVLKKSWNKAVFPKPFTKMTISFSDPIYVRPKADDEALEDARRKLQVSLDSLE